MDRIPVLFVPKTSLEFFRFRMDGPAVDTLLLTDAHGPAGVAVAVVPELLGAVGETGGEHRGKENLAVANGFLAEPCGEAPCSLPARERLAQLGLPARGKQ